MLPYHVKFLQLELARRKQKNPRYSLRAFAQSLKLDSAALSRILNGKQDISLQACLSMIQKLTLDEEERRLFLASVAQERMNRAVQFLTKALQGHGESLLTSSTTDPAGLSLMLPTESIVAHSADLIFVSDRQGRALYVNPEGAKAVGMTPASVIGKTAIECGISPELAKVLDEQAQEVFESRTKLIAELCFPCPSGPRYFERLVTPITGHDGNVDIVITNARDITYRRKSRERLSQLLYLSETLSDALTPEKVREIVVERAIAATEAAGADIIGLVHERTDLRARPVGTVSPALLKSYEALSLEDPSPLGEANIPAQPMLMQDLEQDAGRFQEFAILMLKEGYRAAAFFPLRVDAQVLGTLCLRFTRPRTFSCEERAFMATFANHSAMALRRTELLYTQSVTTEDLKALLSKYETAIRQFPVGVAIVEAPTGRVLLISDELKRILGLPKQTTEPLSGHGPFQNLLRPDGSSFQPAEFPLMRSLKRGEIVTGEEFVALRSDHARVCVLCRSTPVRDADGRIVGATLTVSEVD